MATLSRMMKKAASSLANRTPHRYYTSATFFTPLKAARQQVLFRIPTYHIHHHLSTLSNSSVDAPVRAMESEVHDLEVVKTPRDFPFKIEDNAGEKIITLTREYEDEKIKVIVRTPDPYTDSHYDNYDDYEDKEEGGQCGDGENKWVEPDQNVELDVCVTKESGQTLELHVTVDGHWMSMHSLALKNPNAPDEDISYYFGNLDYDLHEAFRRYLKARGIFEHTTTKFLHDYMVNKERKEHTAWEKHLKNFISN